jgi:hypothetical protein
MAYKNQRKQHAHVRELHSIRQPKQVVKEINSKPIVIDEVIAKQSWLKRLFKF